MREEFASLEFIPKDTQDKVHKTISIGVVEYYDNIKPLVFVDLADKKMYQAKQQGKNQTCV
jgi:PleD family two-component response regulator